MHMADTDLSALDAVYTTVVDIKMLGLLARNWTRKNKIIIIIFSIYQPQHCHTWLKMLPRPKNMDKN
jgi:hypothetical protein